MADPWSLARRMLIAFNCKYLRAHHWRPTTFEDWKKTKVNFRCTVCAAQAKTIDELSRRAQMKVIKEVTKKRDDG